MSDAVVPVPVRKQKSGKFSIIGISCNKVNCKRWLISAVLFLMVGGAVLAGFFERSNLMAYDTCFRIRGVQDPGKDIILIGIDDKSIRDMGSFPFKRSIHAQLLEKVQGARVTGFDLLFDLPTEPNEDKAFAEALAQNQNVVLTSRFSFEETEAGEVAQLFRAPLGEFLEGAGGLGFSNLSTDADEVVRRVTMVDLNTTDKPYPNFGLAVALKAVGGDQSDIRLEPGKVVSGKVIIPIDEYNRAMPYFWGPQGTFKTYSYKEALDLSPSIFKDKIVLVGITDAAAHDYFPTPFSNSNYVLKGNLPSPGVEIHASVVQSILRNQWFREVPGPIFLLFLFVVCLLTTAVVAGRGPWLGFLGTIGILCLIISTAYGLWFYKRLWLPPSAPVFLAFLDYAVLTSANFLQAELERRKTRTVLRRYVSPDVAEQLMRNPEDISLGGSRREVTVMFCDIRDFTQYSENKDPEQVVNRLNQYFTAMTKVIFNRGGTLDKYLGDGLMAVFGAPVYYSDHVNRAIHTAVEIIKEVDRLNCEWALMNEAPLRIGIGINSGSVLVGNVGSPERMDYTVIGEDVNLASRLEGQTKVFNTPVVISDRSVKKLGASDFDQDKLYFLGSTEIKGFTQQIGIYTISDLFAANSSS